MSLSTALAMSLEPVAVAAAAAAAVADIVAAGVPARGGPVSVNSFTLPAAAAAAGAAVPARAVAVDGADNVAAAAVGGAGVVWRRAGEEARRAASAVSAAAAALARASSATNCFCDSAGDTASAWYTSSCTNSRNRLACAGGTLHGCMCACGCVTRYRLRNAAATPLRRTCPHVPPPGGQQWQRAPRHGGPAGLPQPAACCRAVSAPTWWRGDAMRGRWWLLGRAPAAARRANCTVAPRDGRKFHRVPHRPVTAHNFHVVPPRCAGRQAIIGDLARCTPPARHTGGVTARHQNNRYAPAWIPVWLATQ